MSVQKRGNSWYIDIRVPGLKRIRQSLGPHVTELEARALEARTRARAYEQSQNTRHKRRPARSIDDALLRWSKTEMKALKSRRETKNHMQACLHYTAGRPLEDIPYAAADLTEAMLRAGLKPATINRRLSVLRRIGHLAVQWGWTDEPLGKRVKLLTEPVGRDTYLTLAEVESLANAAQEASEAVWILVRTGARASELWNAVPSEVRNGTWTIQQSKSGRTRAIPLHPGIQGMPLPPAITRAVFRRHFERARLEIGQPQLRMHDLRHTFASLFAAAGGTMLELKVLLGHSTLSQTTRYAHLFPGALEEAIRRMG